MNKTYYAQLKKLVLNFVEHYQEDFLVHDKKLLRGYSGSFLMGIRNTGTNTVLLDEFTKEHDLTASRIWLLSYNEVFYFGEKGTIREIKKDECIEIFDEFVEGIAK